MQTVVNIYIVNISTGNVKDVGINPSLGRDSSIVFRPDSENVVWSGKLAFEFPPIVVENPGVPLGTFGIKGSSKYHVKSKERLQIARGKRDTQS